MKKYFINKLIGNDRLNKFNATLFGCALYAQNVLATTAPRKGPDALGWKLLKLARQWGYWVLLIMCIWEIVMSAIKGEKEKTVSIATRYIIIYLSMYLVPEIYNAIRDGFEN